MKTEEKTNSHYLSKSNSDCLKGIFAVCVLMHHLYLYSGILRDTIFANIFQNMGYLSVSVFFFLSGYGLMASYNSKGNNYIKQFPYKRLLPYYCIIILLIFIYSITNIIMKNEISITDLIKSLVDLETTIFFGWYLQVQLLFYVLFLIAFSIYKTRKLQIGFLALCVMVYCLISIYKGEPITRYESVFPFVLGFIWNAKIGRIDSFLENSKHWLWIVALTLFLFCGVILLQLCNFNSGAILILKMLSAILFVVLIMLQVSKIRIDYRFTRLLGAISMEIYVMQGVFIILLRSKFIYISNPYIYIALIIIGTTAAAILVHPLFKYIYKVFGQKMVQSQTVSA